MKILLSTISIILAAFLCSCQKAALPQSPIGATSVKVCEGFPKEFNKTLGKTQISDDFKTLKLKSSGNWWNTMYQSKSGIFKPETDYKITLKYKADKVSTALFLVRDLKDTKGTKDFATGYVQSPTNGEWKDLEIRFRTKKESANHAFQIHALKDFQGEVKDFIITENSDAYYPAIQDAGTYKGDLGKLPTGSKKFDVDLPKNKGKPVVNAADFGVDENSKDFVKRINQAIEHCKKIGAGKLVLNKGNYYSTETYPLLFEGMTDFEFDGNGSTIVFFKKKSCNMRINNCVRTKIGNFNFDWDWSKDPLGSIVQIVGNKKDGDNSYVDFEFIDYKNEQYPQREIRVGHISPIDPKTRSIGVEDGKAASWEMYLGRNPKLRKEWLSGNVIRIFVKENQVIFDKGELYRMNHYYYDLNGTTMDSNTHLTLENLNVYSCPGHAFVIAGKQQYWQFINVNIKFPPNSPKRAVTCTADHCHISRSKGFFKMINCQFGFGGDDCLNAHDCSLFVRPNSPKTVRTVNGRNTWTISVGCPVEIRQGDYSPTGITAKVTQIKLIDKEKGISEVTLDTPLPTEKFDGFIFFNRDYGTENIILKNCYFHENKARGVLILSSNVTIDNCKFFHNESAALKFETGYTFKLWSEGYGVNNVVVRNCAFDTVNSRNGQNDGKLRDIFMGIYMKTDPSADKTMYPILNNILFENNTFKNSAGLVAFITSTGNVTFRNNTMINDTPRKNEVPYRGGYWVAYSTNTKIINNTWVESPYVTKPGVFADADSVKNLLVAGNKIVKKK